MGAASAMHVTHAVVAKTIELPETLKESLARKWSCSCLGLAVLHIHPDTMVFLDNQSHLMFHAGAAGGAASSASSAAGR